MPPRAGCGGGGRAALPGNTWMQPHECPRGPTRGHLDGGRGHTSAHVHMHAGTHSQGRPPTSGSENTHPPCMVTSQGNTHTSTRPYVPTDMVMGRSQHPPTYVCGDICTIRYRCRHTHSHSHGLRDVHPPVSTYASHSLHVHSQVVSNLPPYNQLSAQVRTEDED